MLTFKEQLDVSHQLEEELNQIDLMEGGTAASRLKRASRKMIARGKVGKKVLKGGGKTIGRTHILRGNKLVKRKKMVSRTQQKMRGIKSGRVMARHQKKMHTARIKNASKNLGLKRLLGVQRTKTNRKLGLG